MNRRKRKRREKITQWAGIILSLLAIAGMIVGAFLL